MPLRQLVTKLSPRGIAVIGGSAIAAILFLYVAIGMVSKPSYSTLMAGLDPARTGKITSTLDAKGIQYQIQNNGTALAVQSSQTAQARIALAGAGLLGTATQPGMSLFDNTQLGSSNFQQQITYQRALEGQIAQAIESIQGVTAAQVNLVLPNPQDQLFSTSTNPATAAVLLSGTTSLDPSSVRGIAQLTASSVPGLSVGKVTITDASGALLWPTSTSANGGGTGGLTDKQAAEASYDNNLAAQVDSMLAATLGPGKAQVQINADLNVNQATQDTLTYSNKGVPLTTHTDTEKLTGSGAAAGAAAGTTANLPTAVTGTGAATGTGGNSNYSHTITDATVGVNKTVTHSVIAPGQINRQTVSLLVDKSVPASSLKAIQAAVANAVGLNTVRGDTISMGQIKFAPTGPTAPSGSPVPASMMGYIKDALVGLGALIFLFFIGRKLKKREREAFGGQPTWVRELETRRPLAALEGGGPLAQDAPTEIKALRPAINVAKRQVEDLIDRDPDRVAQQVRAWMSED
jgi:flagellar M-ring protein FliF